MPTTGKWFGAPEYQWEYCEEAEKFLEHTKSMEVPLPAPAKKVEEPLKSGPETLPPGPDAEG